MAIGKTLLINKALTLIGAAPISNIDDESNNAAVLRNVYEISLRAILSECEWNFAKKRALLSESTDTLAWYDTGEGIVYVRPADAVRIFSTNSKGATWREEGDYIVSDTNGLGVRYVYYRDEPVKFPALFVDAFVDKLAADIAYMVVNSGTLGQAMMGKYEKISLPKATAANAQTGVQQVLQDDAWELAKYSNGQYDA